MVNYCILCHVYSRTPDVSVTFHRFPKDKNQRRKWLQAINMDQAAELARLCSNHFKSTDFQETIYGQRRCLKRTAIPTIISRETNFDDIKAASIEEQCHTEIQINTRNLEITSEEQSDRIKIEESSMECNDAANDNPNSLKRKSMGDEEFDFPLRNIRSMKDINVNEVSKNVDEAKIVIEVAMETIQEQRRKIHNLQSNISKLKKRIHNLNVLNNRLRSNNLISDKAMKHLNISI